MINSASLEKDGNLYKVTCSFRPFYNQAYRYGFNESVVIKAVSNGLFSFDNGLFIESGKFSNEAYDDNDRFRKSVIKLIILDGIESISYNSFSGLSNLKEIELPGTLTEINNGAFSYCRGLTSITIPKSVEYIGEYAFRDCQGLSNITIPNSVTVIDDNAFENCTGLTNITIPDSVKRIGDDVFEYCDNLTSITIPTTLTDIGSNAFPKNAKIIRATSLT